MGMRELEREVVKELQTVTGNPKLRIKDIMEWSTGDIKPHPGETLVFLPKLRVNVSYKP